MTERQEESTSLAGLAHGQLCYLQIPALDVTASARFYERVFGWRVSPPDAGFEAPAIIGEWVTDRPPAPDAGPVGWISVKDVRETLAEAEWAGATAREAPSRDGPRWLASFLDPAGNLIGIAQHPHVQGRGGNRTMPSATVMPVLVYDDVPRASDWLCSAFGFVERWRADAHRAVLEFAGGAVMLGDRGDGAAGDTDGPVVAPAPADSVMVRVADVDSHCARARRAMADVTAVPRDFPYGERQYSALDIGGHRWTFSQSIADRVPEEWGGTSGPGL